MVHLQIFTFYNRKELKRNMKETDKILAIIASTYCIALLLFLAIFGYTPTNDGDGYIEFAQVCIQSKQAYPCLPLIMGQTFIWNIGSINLTALSLLCFNSLYPLLIFLCFLKALTVLFIGKIAHKLFSGKVAIIASIMFVLYPNNIGQSTTILSEIPMICFGSILYSHHTRKIIISLDSRSNLRIGQLVPSCSHGLYGNSYPLLHLLHQEKLG